FRSAARAGRGLRQGSPGLRVRAGRDRRGAGDRRLPALPRRAHVRVPPLHGAPGSRRGMAGARPEGDSMVSTQAARFEPVRLADHWSVVDVLQETVIVTARTWDQADAVTAAEALDAAPAYGVQWHWTALES